MELNGIAGCSKQPAISNKNGCVAVIYEIMLIVLLTKLLEAIKIFLFCSIDQHSYYFFHRLHWMPSIYCHFLSRLFI